MEYEWEVAIDVDNDRATGDGGFDTLLSAYHIVRLSEGRENMQVPIESKAKASVWKMEPGSTMTVRDASLDVSADEDTITLIHSWDHGRITACFQDVRVFRRFR